MKKICILIPTYENTKALQYLMEKISKEAYDAHIDIYICDSSKTENNKQLIEAKYEAGFNNIFFLQGEITSYTNQIYDKFDEPDYKVVMAEKHLIDKYDYIWLSADGYILKIRELKDILVKFMNEDVDIIHFDDSNNDKKTIYYKDCREFYINDSWHMTKFSSAIIATHVIEKMNSQDSFRKYYGSCFLILMSIFDYCAKHDFLAVHYNYKYCTPNPLKRASGWILKGIAFNIFGKNWIVANNQLPAAYDSVKSEAIINHSIKSGVFGYKNCVRLRAYKNITVSKILKYKELIPVITKTNLLWFWLLALIPSTFLKTVIIISDWLKSRHENS